MIHGRDCVREFAGLVMLVLVFVQPGSGEEPRKVTRAEGLNAATTKVGTRSRLRSLMPAPVRRACHDDPGLPSLCRTRGNRHGGDANAA